MMIRKSSSLIAYPDAMLEMEDLVAKIQAGHHPNTLWFLEHLPVYTAGTSAQREDLLDSGNVEISYTGRGGQWTYHGPGQRIVYILMRLKLKDVRRYVQCLEKSIVEALHGWGITGETIPGRIGVWVNYGGGSQKIAAIGVRIQKWTTSHGLALNVSPDLDAYRRIIPCGIRDAGVTSLAELGVFPSPQEVDDVLQRILSQNLTLFEGEE